MYMLLTICFRNSGYSEYLAFLQGIDCATEIRSMNVHNMLTHSNALLL